MGKIFVLIGKSASGKDTVYARLLKDGDLPLRPFVIYTTRPMRVGETDGVEYHFSTEQEMREFENNGRLIESRVYHTVYGDWYYFTVDDAKNDVDKNDYLYIGTLESFVKLKDYYGKEKVVPLYIEVEDGIRLQRALQREMKNDRPGYAELCRRFLTDSEDFSEEKIREAGIEKRFENIERETCLQEIKEEIRKHL